MIRMACTYVPGINVPFIGLWKKIGLSHRPKRNPKGITKADRKARKSDDLLKRDFTSEEKPLGKLRNRYR